MAAVWPSGPSLHHDPSIQGLVNHKWDENIFIHVGPLVLSDQQEVPRRLCDVWNPASSTTPAALWTPPTSSPRPSSPCQLWETYTNRRVQRTSKKSLIFIGVYWIYSSLQTEIVLLRTATKIFPVPNQPDVHFDFMASKRQECFDVVKMVQNGMIVGKRTVF